MKGWLLFSAKISEEVWACPHDAPSPEIYPRPRLSLFKPCHSLSARLAAYHSALVPVLCPQASQTLHHPAVDWQGGTKTYLSDTIHPPVKTGGHVEIILPKTQIGHRRYFAEHHNFTGDRFRCYVIYLAKKGCQGWLWGGRRRRQAMLIQLLRRLRSTVGIIDVTAVSIAAACRLTKVAPTI